MISAIFCRGCGEKLNLDELKPEDFLKTDTKKNKGDLANKVVGIVLIVLTALLLVALLCPSCNHLTPQEVGEDLRAKYECVVNGNATGDGVQFTSQELTDLLTWRLKAYAGELGQPHPEAYSVRAMTDGSLKVVVASRMYFIPFSLSCIVRLEDGVPTPDDYKKSPGDWKGPVKVMCEKIRVGILPLPSSLEEKFLPNFSLIVRRITSEFNNDKIVGVWIGEDNVSLCQKLPPRVIKKTRSRAKTE